MVVLVSEGPHAFSLDSGAWRDNVRSHSFVKLIDSLQGLFFLSVASHQSIQDVFTVLYRRASSTCSHGFVDRSGSILKTL